MMAPLLFAVSLLTSAFTLSASSQLNAIVDRGISSDIFLLDLKSVETVEDFNTVETFLDGYLHRHSYPPASSGCVGLVTIATEKLNKCRQLDYGSYKKTVATSTTITITSYSDMGCVTAVSTVKKSYTLGVCNSQILYSINNRFTADLTVPRVTRSYFGADNYRCSGDETAGDTYLLDTCAEGIKYTLSGTIIGSPLTTTVCDNSQITIMDWSQLKKRKYSSKTCIALPDSVEEITDAATVGACEYQRTDEERAYLRWVLSNTSSTSPQPTSPPSSQVVLLDGYVNTMEYINASCKALVGITSKKLNECSDRLFATATSTVITITGYNTIDCGTGTENSVKKISYKAGVCKSPTSPTTEGFLYSISPQISSDILVPRVTSSDYSDIDDKCEADPLTGDTYLLDVCVGRGQSVSPFHYIKYTLSGTIIGSPLTTTVCDNSQITIMDYKGHLIGSEYYGDSGCTGYMVEIDVGLIDTCVNGIFSFKRASRVLRAYNLKSASTITPSAAPTTPAQAQITTVPNAAPTTQAQTTTVPNATPTTPTQTTTVPNAAPTTPTQTTTVPNATPTAKTQTTTVPNATPTTPTQTQTTTVPNATPTTPTQTQTTTVPNATPTAKTQTTTVPNATPTTPLTTSEKSTSSKDCFAGSETVRLATQEVRRLSDVRVGDLVLAADAAGKTFYSDVVFVPHGPNTQRSLFTHITTAGGRSIKMTSNHIIPSGSCTSTVSLPLVYASKVRVGDCIMTVSGQETVSAVEVVQGEGLYTIVTGSEYLVVNDIIVSPFAYSHAAANSFYNIHRFLYTTTPSFLKWSRLISANEAIGTLLPMFGYTR